VVIGSRKIIFPAATISSFSWSTSTHHDVDVARQAAAGFGSAAALEAERWLVKQSEE
jgi:hypothetical protein